MPTFRDDISGSSGPRAYSFTMWKNLNKHGNNDAIFKCSVLNLDIEHGSYRYQKSTGQIIDDDPKREQLKIGGEIHTFKRFGFQTNIGSWHVPSDKMWKLKDAREEV